MSFSFKKVFTQHFIFWIAIAVTMAIYFKSLYFPFISWDDPEMVFKNKDVINFNFAAIFSNHYVGNYLPLTMLTHALNWALFENNAFGHHLINLLFHVCNGYLVYKLTNLVFKQKYMAELSAIIFLLHPLQIESVAWIAELKNVGYAFFYLLGLVSYVNYAQAKKNKNLYLAASCFILACLYKPSAVVFPLSLLCIDLFIHKKFEIKFLLTKIPFLFIAVVFGVINLKTQAADQFINYAHAFPFYERIGNAGIALYNYILLFLVPHNLSVIYPFPIVKTIFLILGGVFFLSIFFILYLLFKKQKFELLSIVLFIIFNLILVLQFIPFGEVLNADRYMYIPLIGFAWLISFFITKINIPKLILPVLLIAALSILSSFRTAHWKSSIVLFEDIIKKYPDNFLALNSLGVENMMKNNDDRALMYFNKATTVAPYNYKGFYNKGLWYLKNNNPKKAIEEFNTVLKLYDYQKAYVARASAYYALLQYKPARLDANAALFKDQKNHKALFVLGNCDNDEGDLPNAISFYNRAIELNNQEPDYYFKRSIALGKQQKFTDCINDLNKCLKLNPNYIEAYYWRGVAKVNLKENPCEDFRRAAENAYAPAKEAYSKFCGR